MFSTYKKEDVTILLKDISGMVTPLPTSQREKLIQAGVHYSEMLPLEYEPSDAYLCAYYKALDLYSGITAAAVERLSDRILEEKGPDTVLVSLARAGTPIGILLKRCIKQKYSIDVAHYTVSIIRGKGIDKNAVDYIIQRHRPELLQFVDGWTGKGAIQGQLNSAMAAFSKIDPGLAVLSDPAGVSALCGTYDDFLIPSSLLNSTVSGLLSRTFYREDLIGASDFHGAAFYSELLDKDLSEEFLYRIQAEFGKLTLPVPRPPENTGLEEVGNICRDFSVKDVNLVKPSIGEATRVLLRRVPWKLLVNSMDDNEHLGHLYTLAKEKGVEVIEYPLKNYRACGIIRNMGDI